MMLIALLLLYLAIHKRFEPLLLVPIGFGGLLANIPGAGLASRRWTRGCTAQSGNARGLARPCWRAG
jgi:Na+-transporting methylmalonyl-CoA/oxaloacetate decarboxylase beta subunit